MNYKIKKVALNINGRMAIFNIKVADEVILLNSGDEVQAICHVKESGEDGNIRFWTSEMIISSEIEALELEHLANSLCKTCFKT